ncbi:MAG: rhomboid family intramembrane serine protease, partial [Phototrophicales bacterium]
QEFIMAPSPDALNQFILDHTPGYQYYRESLYNFVNIDYAANPNNAQYINDAKMLVRDIFEQAANVPMVGASGAILGVVMGFAFLFPNIELMLIFPPIPIKAKYIAVIYAGYDIYAMIQNQPDDNVAHLAHIGGMIFAIVLLKIWKIQRPNYFG